MSEEIQIDDINGICRLCLKCDFTIIPIFGREIRNRDCIPLSRKILDCVSIKVQNKDDLPKMICVGCVSQIDSWHGFKNICDKSQEKLINWLNKQLLIDDQSSSDIIIQDIPSSSQEIVVLDSDEEMQVEKSNYNSVQPNLTDKNSLSVDAMIVTNDEDDCDVVSLRSSSESIKSNLDSNNLKISGTCSLLSDSTKQNNVVLENAGYDSDSNGEFNGNSKNLDKIEKPVINDLICSNITSTDENLNKSLFKNGDSTIVNSMSKSDSPQMHQNQAKCDLDEIICSTKDIYKINTENDFDFSEDKIISLVVESLIKSVEKEKSQETTVNNYVDNDALVVDSDSGANDDSSIVDMHNKNNTDPICGDTNIVIEGITSLVEQKKLVENKSVKNSLQQLNKKEQQDENQSDLVVLSSSYEDNNSNLEIARIQIKEEPMSEEEAEVNVDESFICHVSIKKEPVDSNDVQDIKPNIRKINISKEMGKYNPQTRKNGKVYCEPCRSTFPNRHKYVRHTQSNRHQINLELFFSGEETIMRKKSSEFSYPTHYKLRNSVDNLVSRNLNDCGRFECPVCSSIFNLKRNFLHHLKLKHYALYINGTGIDSSGSNHFDTTYFNIPCPNCGNKFPSNKSLKLHEAMMHQPMDNECKNCNRKFLRRTAMIAHIRYCGLQSSSHACSICSKEFTTTASFVAHKQNCKLPKPRVSAQQSQLLYCTLCTENFKTTSDLITHVRSNHSVQDMNKTIPAEEVVKTTNNHSTPAYEGSKPNEQSKPTSDDNILYCKYCSRTFYNHGALSSHLGYHTRKESFECKLCLNITKTIKSFKQHMRKHLNESNNRSMCWICYTPFATPEKLRKHKPVHIKLRIFKCNRCENSYHSLIALTRHKKRDHNIDNTVKENEISDEINPQVVELQQGWEIDESEEQDQPQCKVCKKKFSTIGNLKRHSYLHIKIKKPILPPTSLVFSAAGHYRCTNCSKMCGTLAGLRTHYKYCIIRGKNVPMGSLNPKQKVRCDKCKQLFASKACLYKHKYLKRCPLVDKTKLGAYSCLSCQKLFTSLPSLQRHMSHCNLSTDKKAICEHCGMHFSSFLVLSGHIQQCGQNILNNTCTICNQRFTNPEELKIHSQTCVVEEVATPNTRAAVATCNICSKQFKYAKSMESHIFKCHPEDLYNCFKCLNRFISHEDLKDHELICPGHQLKPNHEPRVSQAMKFKCFKCNEVCMSMEDLEIHSFNCEEESSRDTETKSRIGYHCRLCGKKFNSRSSLYRHKLESHSTTQLPEDQPPYTCTKCPGLSFHKKKGLLEHLEWHDVQVKIKKDSKKEKSDTDVKLTCELCDEQFVTESLYQDHMEAHMNIDLESNLDNMPTSSKQTSDLVHCDICNKGFDNKQSLKSHRASHFRNRSLITSNKVHLQTTPKRKVKHVKCNVCFKWLSKNSIIKHRRIHTREGSSNSYSGQSSVTHNSKNNSLQLDDSIQSLSESQTVFPCTICNKIFGLRKSLHDHLKNHNIEGLDEKMILKIDDDDDDDGASTSSMYECKFCDLTWNHKIEYIKHLSTRRHKELEEQLEGII